MFFRVHLKGQDNSYLKVIHKNVQEIANSKHEHQRTECQSSHSNYTELMHERVSEDGEGETAPGRDQFIIVYNNTER